MALLVRSADHRAAVEPLVRSSALSARKLELGREASRNCAHPIAMTTLVAILALRPLAIGGANCPNPR
jgi:multidrug efflux pump subunit AcrB